MATGKSGSFTIAGTKNMSAVCYWSETYDASANTHYVSITGVSLISTNWYGFMYYPNGTLSIGGVTCCTFNSGIPTHQCMVSAQNTEYAIYGVNGYASPPYTVGPFTGNADGTCSVNIALEFRGWTYDGSGASGFTISGSRTVSLQTVSRVSYVGISNCTMGSATTLTISRSSSSFTHTLTYSFGNATGTIATKTSETSISWTPPLTLANQIPNSVSGTVQVTIQTYNGTTLVGTTANSATLSVPASVVPTFTGISVTKVDGDVPSSWGIYVQNKSKATLAITGAAGVYGSTITAYSITGNNLASTSSSVTTGFLTNAGHNSFSARVQDSRGRWSNTISVGFNVVEYAPPSFSNYSILRCTSAGTTSANGTYGKGAAVFEFASCSGKNSVTTAVAYKKSSDTDYTNAGKTFTSGTAFIFGGGNLSVDYTYDIRYSLTDAFGTVSVVQTLSTASVLMDFKSGGTGLAIGKVSEKDNFECAWDADFGGKVRVNALDDIMIGDTPLSQLIGGGSSSLEKAYPIGSIYITTIATNPATILGFGRWERIQDKFLLAGGSSYAPGTSGGEASHTLALTEVPSHCHGVGTIAAGNTTPSMSATLNHATANYFRGYMMRDTGSTSASGEYAAAGSSAAKGFALDTAMSISVSGGSHSHTMSGNTGYSGGSTAHNNMPPYLSVYVWKRVSDTPTPSYSVSAVSGAAYSFALNSSGYYESQNKGVQDSYAVCKVNFNCEGKTMYLDCINFGESTFDFGLVGNVDTALSLSTTVDSTVIKNFSGSQSADVQSVYVGAYPSGSHYLYVKYKKDSSVDQNNDSLQFKVRFV